MDPHNQCSQENDAGPQGAEICNGDPVHRADERIVSMTKLTGGRKERLTEVLREQKRRMWNELREHLFTQSGQVLQPEYEIPQDAGDRGLIDLLEDTGLALADIRQGDLIQMEEAERKLREGSYGFCEECGAEIDEGRLALIPFANYCVDCQKLHEGPASPRGVTM
jgi:DnaK suppressor protein